VDAGGPDLIQATMPHHNGNGRFRNPWPGARLRPLAALPLWSAQRLAARLRGTLPPQPNADAFPAGTPAFARPRARATSCGVTWIGHSTCLLQLAGANVLTDPVFSDFASPVRGVGPRRLVPPGLALADLPPLDVVLLSHNHYDHFDTSSLRALAAAHPQAQWVCPLKLGPAVRALGARTVHELDWWASAALATAGGELTVTGVPAQHFSGRTPFDRDATLWCGYALAGGGRRVLFAGDTGLHPEFARIGETCGPFDVALMPIGAYDPRWFMKPVHMNPEEAVEAFRALSGRADGPGAFVPIHWGTFQLTDEPLDEPPRRLRAAWAGCGLPAELLWILRHGETRELASPAVRAVAG